MVERIRLIVRGVVQGVGFRPFVYGLAVRLNLAGFVSNAPEGVVIEIEGASRNLQAFEKILRQSPPQLARIHSMEREMLPPLHEKGFIIRQSRQSGKYDVLISPDVATCSDCLREMNDPADRRYKYPFVNCTNCGPRYTIICDLPYDRTRTTMAVFELCPQCRREYNDPANRRFHAEPVCCPACGPRLTLLKANGEACDTKNPVAECIDILHTGGIVAIKGLGGYHLACDASNDEAVTRLRRRKQRGAKPFAIMVRQYEQLENIVELSRISGDMLREWQGPARPIVLFPKRYPHNLSEQVAPASDSFGVMLPYTPLHHLLMEGDFQALVMTSGNLSDEPICYQDDNVVERLGALADFILSHDREIYIRTDDSVLRPVAGKLRFLRRSRGYVPHPVSLPCDTSSGEILAVGPELNNTICVTRKGEAFLSHHIGNLENTRAYEAFLQAVAHLQDVFRVSPEYVACDLHPGYLSTRFAQSLELPRIEVQHHHAHIASVLAECHRDEQVIGVAFDGLGWGTDGTLWGGEFLVADLINFERVACLEPIQQPGGDMAAHYPPRMAYAYIRKAFGAQADILASELLPSLSESERAMIDCILEQNVNSPLTSSMGRLFDAVSAVLGICVENCFHAQAPAELESIAWQAEQEDGLYPCVSRQETSLYYLPGPGILRALVDDFCSGTTAPICAARFHNTVAQATVDICIRIRENKRLDTVALSGGVFANAFLTGRLVNRLKQEGFEVLLNEQVPAGDGGIALGQAAVAARRNLCV